MIELKNVSKVYETKDNKVEALKNISLKVNKGDIFGVIGFSGAGKSTLIRTVNLLERPSSGDVIVDNKNLVSLSKKELRDTRKQIGMIFQHFNLLNSKTVYDNVAIPLKLNKASKADIDKRVKELLEFVGLSNKAKSYPSELSGGEKQRIGIARALATNPLILLCDEATSALDPQTTESILKLLKKINKEYNITILIITHEMNVIREICNRVAVMEKGEIIEQGDILEVFGSPKKAATKNFVSTVIQDKVPESVYEIINNENTYSRIFKLKFVGKKAGKPLISDIGKRFDVDTNILFANVTELQGTTLGHLTIEVSGEQDVVDKAYEYILAQDILVGEVFR